MANARCAIAGGISAVVGYKVRDQNRLLAFYCFKPRDRHCLGGCHAGNDDSKGEGGRKKLAHRHTFTQLLTNHLADRPQNQALACMATP